MARLRRYIIRSRRAGTWEILMLALIAAVGCRSHRSALKPQEAPAVAAAVAPAQPGIQLTDFCQATPNQPVACQPTAYQVREEELPAAARFDATADSLPLGMADAVERLTLEQAVATAVERNPRLRQAMARVGGARAG